MSDDEDEDGDFFTSKKNQRKFDDADDNASEIEAKEDEELKEEIKQKELKINKKKLKKITKEGPF